MRDFYRLLRVSWPYIGCVLGFYSLSRGLGIGVGDFGSLLYVHVLRINVVWFLASFVFMFLVYTNVKHRGIPLTATNTEIELRFLDAEGRRAEVLRTQTLRANREDVTGYLKEMWADGEIPEDSIECTISHCGRDGHTVLVDGAGSHLEVIHRFPAIPRSLLRLGLNTVVRTEKVVYLNAFMNRRESYEVKIPPRYRHHRVEIRVLFHPDRPCQLSACNACRINAHGITDLPLHLVRADGTNGVKVVVRRTYEGDRFRIWWTWPSDGTSSVHTTAPRSDAPHK